MAYILTSDLKKFIQSDNLNQIIGNDTTVLSALIDTAESELKTYLVQKYLIDAEFAAYEVFQYPHTYLAGARVYLDADAYDATETYNTDDLALHSGGVYRCLNTGVTGAWDDNDWSLLGTQYAKFYAILPADYSYFDYTLAYNVGDKVVWKNKKYTALQASTVLSTSQAIQYGTYQSLPYSNVFPDDPNYGAAAWGTGVALSYVNQLVTNAGVWASGDNRNPELVMHCIDIALYHLHSRIAPRNIPELRVKRYDDAIRKLRNYAKGDDVTLNLPKIQPKSGARIRYGGNVKQVNSY